MKYDKMGSERICKLMDGPEKLKFHGFAICSMCPVRTVWTIELNGYRYRICSEECAHQYKLYLNGNNT